MAKAKKTLKKAKKTLKKAKAKSKTKVKTQARTKKATAAKAQPRQKMAPKPSGLKLGQALPPVQLPATGNQVVDLQQLGGKKVVLFFYPKDMTPGCTIEGHEFTKLRPEFESKNAVVFGVSRDSVQSHEKFKEKECYTIDLLSDTDEKLCKTFGVIKDKNMYGKIVRGIERSTFVLNEQGQLIKEWRGVRAEGHASEVLDYLKNLS